LNIRDARKESKEEGDIIEIEKNTFPSQRKILNDT
jgi:hypothetical protein